MPLSPGSRLGPYEVVSRIGAGGMGEVFRARDTRLGRDVALKALPDQFTSDAERLARFDQEARALAALDHPNVASIYGLEQLDGASCLVMQLAPGEDLSARLRRGPIPLEEALTIARQIALALEAAHDHGIIHRDLKPANIKVDEDGGVKVLDFGLAKALDPASDRSEEDIANSPTMVRASTDAGIILGTAAYMSPEQARGRRVDRRADIWAYGVVCWEMLTGDQLFAGETVSDTLASVLRAEVDLARLPPATPGPVRALLRRCLERDPRNRLRDIGDARLVLDDAIAGIDAAPAAGAQRGPTSARAAVPVALWIAAIAATAAAAWWAGRAGAPDADAVRPSHRYAIRTGDDQWLHVAGNSVLTFSPDASWLVLVGTDRGRRVLLRRQLSRTELVPIDGTEDGTAPFISPDGRWIGFVARGQLMKVPAAGGRPFPVGEARGAGGGAFLDAGAIVFAPIYSDGLFRVSAEGGEPERLTSPNRDDGELGHWWPDVVPGGRFVVFTAFRTPIDKSRVGLLELATRRISWIVDGGFFGRWSPSGHVVFARGDRLFAQPFDPDAGAVTGSATAVMDDVSVSPSGGYAQFAIGRDGTLAFVSQSLGYPPAELLWLDRTGRATPAAKERRRIGSVSLSPDGRSAALTIRGESDDLWLYSFDRGTLSRLTSGADTEFDPRWSRDGRELYYVLDRPPFQLFRIAAGGAGGSGAPIWPGRQEFDTVLPSVSPDGRLLAFAMTEPDTGSNLYSRGLEADAEARPFRVTRGDLGFPTFSPDGRWLAYQSDETGRYEIYVDAFPGPGDRIQITSDGGREPLWAGNGEIFYRREDALRVVPVRTAGRIEAGVPQTLFVYSFASANDLRTYDVLADGSRVLVTAVPEASRPRQIEIVTAWTGQLNAAGR